jgi:thiosulfate dehydrogenase
VRPRCSGTVAGRLVSRKTARGFILGVAAALIALVAGGYAAIVTGMMPANADRKPSRFERWAARRSLRATIARDAPRRPNPVPATLENYTRGIKLYRENCAVCHGAADAKPSSIAEGLYIDAPQLAKHGVEDDPAGVTFWKIKHGIRFTGMPSYGKTLSDQQIWRVTLFLEHMDRLPAQAQQAWKAVPSQGASSKPVSLTVTTAAPTPAAAARRKAPSAVRSSSAAR